VTGQDRAKVLYEYEELCMDAQDKDIMATNYDT